MADKKAKSHRELIDTGRDKRFVRRDDEGRFEEATDVGRSLAQDRKQAASTKYRLAKATAEIKNGNDPTSQEIIQKRREAYCVSRRFFFERYKKTDSTNAHGISNRVADQR
ncbi:MAG TPA: hypothetical protein VJ372_16120 [Pyrinomonadaceae bacterium]|jgi:hypothetical protein|nr:hypothetical protein [Pyrinomonadaceae bacterium]